VSIDHLQEVFKHFLDRLDNILNPLHRNKNEIIIRGDINVNYLVTSHGRQQLHMLLSTYNLINSVQFPTQIVNISSTAVDNVFIDKTRMHTICPIVNGLSDHNAQEIQLSIVVPLKCMKQEKQERGKGDDQAKHGRKGYKS
jgi:hypothetical protein